MDRGIARVPCRALSMVVTIDGGALRIDDVVRVARGRTPVEVHSSVRERMAESRALVERIDAAGTVAYGVTTGFGALADRAIAPADRVALQRAGVRRHAAGVRAPLPAEVVRGAVVARARSLASCRSRARIDLIEALGALLRVG